MTGLTGRTVIVEDAAALAETAADWLIEHLAARPGRLAICLNGGSTPKHLYALLAAEPQRARIPWDRIHWFVGDDRAVPSDDERSNARMIHEALLEHVPAPADHVHLIPATGSPEVDAVAYEQTLKAFYGADALDPDRPLFDILLLGMGGDGHTASLFPGKASLDTANRWVTAGEPGLDPFVPRVTLTFSALASSSATAFLVAGADKADALRRIAGGESLPASRVRSAGDLVWFLDRAAAGGLP